MLLSRRTNGGTSITGSISSSPSRRTRKGAAEKGRSGVLLLLLLILLGTVTDVTPDLSRDPGERVPSVRGGQRMADPLSNLGGGLGTRSNPAARLGYTMVFERRGQAYENRQRSPARSAAATAAVDKAPPRRLPSSHCPYKIARAFPSSRALGGSGSAPEAALSGKVDVDSLD